MLKLLRILLKIILAPFIFLFSCVLFLVEQVFGLVAGIGMIFSVIFGIYGIYCLFDPVHGWAATPALISAFLISPFGIPLLGGIIVVKATDLRDWLKAI